jgi:hypothetical protein
MCFDAAHELVHILTNKMTEDDKDVEKWVDKVTEQLIYPPALLENEFPIIKVKKPLKDKDFNFEKLKAFIYDYEMMSVRGLAKALVSYGYINEDLQVYTWLYESLHAKLPKRTGTRMGQMNFNFEDSFEFEKFYDEVVESNPNRYPLFVSLRDALVEKRISPRAFANLFNMDSGDVDELRVKWSKI